MHDVVHTFLQIIQICSHYDNPFFVPTFELESVKHAETKSVKSLFLIDKILEPDREILVCGDHTTAFSPKTIDVCTSFSDTLNAKLYLQLVRTFFTQFTLYADIFPQTYSTYTILNAVCLCLFYTSIKLTTMGKL